MHNSLIHSAIAVAAFSVVGSASAIDIQLDFGSNAFFASNATARAAVEAAAADLEAAITTTLGATPDTVSGTDGSFTYTIDVGYGYLNPDNNTVTQVPDATLALDAFKVFVGTRPLNSGGGGSTQTLGRGGPGSFGFASGGSGSLTSFDQFENAVLAADAAADAAYPRVMNGPVVGSLGATASASGGGQTREVPFEFEIGPTVGSLAFDSTSNGGAISSTTFHFDHTAPVAAGKIDLYTVALHEILHTLGIGTYDSWDDNVSGSDWTGGEVIALLGSGVGIIEPGHIADDIMGTVNGVSQEVVMSPLLDAGERRFLTDVDLAFLRDIGWTTAAIPEPGSVAFLALGGLALRRRR